MLVLQYTLIFTTVLALVALGGMFAERSGVINLGLEGIMVIGALTGAIVSAYLTKINTPIFLNVVVSILSSMLAGWIFSMLLGVACITFKADQTLVGTALNIMSTAFAVVVARMYTKTPSSEIAYVSSMYKTILSIDKTGFLVILIILLIILATFAVLVFYSKTNKIVYKYLNINGNKMVIDKYKINMDLIIKIVSVALVALALVLVVITGTKESINFKIEISWFLLMMLILVVASYIFLFKTTVGMRLMSCGEHPQAAGSVGINVYFQRYLGVSISGVLAGLGGFAYIVQSAGCWDFKYGVAGFGFLALAVMIFGQWKPFRIFLAALIFGLCQTVSVFYAGRWGIPQFVYKMLPYVVCMVVLIMTSKKSKAPKAEGIPYDKGQR